MHLSSYPFTIRLIGFTPAESARLEALLARAPGVGPSYSCLHDDSLQEPDLYIANGDSPTALTRLGCLPPGSLQPALVIGNPGNPGAEPWRTLARPIDPLQLYEALAELLDTRVQVLVQQSTRTVRRVLAERRRRPRLAPDCETPAFYTRLRRGPVDGAVLIVDKECQLRNQVARVLGPRRVPVEWTDSLCAAVRLCDETPVSLVLINTAAVGIEPYEVCSSIKSQDGAQRTPVVFLVEQSFHYDSARARRAGARGLLTTPVAGRHWMLTFQKLMDLPV
ncbi:response regulator [Massilia sp. CFBP9026]|uniref:response regulator n=1 Tax=Massilia sp. CFBP9026 TaxID=3096536 RepID=UPI002A6B6E21|nr:response regulator [Massilia sp. CFBP9026]MDY0961500.1 response regulator [Massilia sp. CFBP9026]